MRRHVCSTSMLKVPAKEPGTVDGVVVAPAALGAWTPAGAQVLIERREVNVRQARALLGHDVAYVSRRPQIAHCCLGAIALPFQHLSKPVEVWPARPAAQMSQHLRCREVGLQHDRPRM